MPVEFISAINANRASDINPQGGSGFNYEFARQYAKALDEGEFDYTLVAYSSSSIDANQFAQFVVNHTERLRPMLAHRPGVIFPTHAARDGAQRRQVGGVAGVHVARLDRLEQRRGALELGELHRVRGAGQLARGGQQRFQGTDLVAEGQRDTGQARSTLTGRVAAV